MTPTKMHHAIVSPNGTVVETGSAARMRAMLEHNPKGYTLYLTSKNVGEAVREPAAEVA